jgi:TM2 domain.
MAEKTNASIINQNQLSSDDIINIVDSQELGGSGDEQGVQLPVDNTYSNITLQRILNACKSSSRSTKWLTILFLIYFAAFIGSTSYVAVNNDKFSDYQALTTNFNCTPNIKDVACNYHGTCVYTGDDCVCDQQYITFNPIDNTKCNYKQKKKVTAFCLQFFFGSFGAGEWYLGNNKLAGGMIAYTIGFFVFVCILSCIAGALCGESPGSLFIACVVCVWFIGLIIWTIYELVSIANGNRLDGNSAPMMDW